MPLTRPKVIAITLLGVLVALGSASLFAQNGSSATTAPAIMLDPTSGCPGTPIIVEIAYPADANGAHGSVTVYEIKLTSNPDGLISSFDGGIFTVGDSVCAGDYVVTAEIPAVYTGVGAAQTPISVSTHFTVGGEGCPNLPSCLRPVGGVVMPTNTLAITAPYLALAGLIAAVSAVVLVKKRRD